MNDVVQSALTAVELRESELLSWGAVGAQWERAELCAVLADFGNPDDLLDQMLTAALVVQTPDGGYRSRSAETIRTLATLRQAFRDERILQGRPLVLDYRFLHRPRRRPRRDIAANDFLDRVSKHLGVRGSQAMTALLHPTSSAFQLRATEAMLHALGSTERAAVVVTAGTGSGKTLAFYLPLLAWLTDNIDPSQNHTAALALYPRNELLKDQLQTLVQFSLKLSAQQVDAAPLSIATWFGSTPQSAHYVRQGWVEGWVPKGRDYLCPNLRCPTCDGELVWPKAALDNDRELLRCTGSTCSTEIDGSRLRLTRESARRSPASVMLSTTESLNRQLSVPGNLRAFGISDQSLRAVLLDEIHTYDGTSGAQNALLLRRLRQAIGREPVWAGLSATLANPEEFFGRLVNVNSGQIVSVAPTLDELEESGAEYLVALRHDPHGSTGTLSSSIQTAMAMSRCLDSMSHNPFNPGADSGGIFGSRLFAFTDKLDSTNRLYWDVLDAEGWAWPGTPLQGQTPLTLAHLRSRDQSRLPVAQRDDATTRDADGQCWWLAEVLGHELDGDVQKRIGRTSSQDRGVANDAEIVIATASLEVGFDDDRVGAVLQHKAPHDIAQFMQRKGRAGRNPATRPWTVVVLSDWGRDRGAWDSYDALFNAEVPARSLPLENLYVLRIQAVYCLLDWLSARLGYQEESSWADAAGPADMLAKNPRTAARVRERQHRMANAIAALLRDGPERESLRRHLRRSLALGSGPVADQVLDQIFWEAPRPLLTSVVPTLRRRLVDQWNDERPAQDDASVRTRTPLRDFIPGNLFDALLVPEVEFQVPSRGAAFDTAYLPALRAIREFLPGNVSRHFGVWAANKRHWVPLPAQVNAQGDRWIDVNSYGGTFVDEVTADGAPVRVFAPTAVSLAPVPRAIRDASSVRPDWEFHGDALGRGVTLSLPASIENLFSRLTSHMHVQGGGVRVMRYAQTGTGSVWNPQPTAVRVRFGTQNAQDWRQAALGVDIHCDAIAGTANLPDFGEQPTPLERSEWLTHRVRSGATLPAQISTFDRAALSDAVAVVVAAWDWDVRRRLEPDAFGAALWDAAVVLGLDPQDPGDLGGWLRDADIQQQLLEAIDDARRPTRSHAWDGWLRRRFVLSAANLLLAALTGWGSSVDSDELTVDLDPQDESGFYISEQSPGGTGQIEAITRRVIENPEALGMAFIDVLRPSDIELMDAELLSVVTANDASASAAIANLAASWRMGHEAARSATQALDETLAGLGIQLGSAARTALATRLAGPGAHPELLDEVEAWLSRRSEASASSGLALEPRTLAALFSQRVSLDGILKLDAPTPARRVQSVANVLWPWGAAAQTSPFYNPYAQDLDGSLAVVRLHWQSPVTIVDFATWDDEVRASVHAALLADGEVLLRTLRTARRALRSGILDLHTVPVEVGPLLCHAHVVGVSDRGERAEARVLLREAW